MFDAARLLGIMVENVRSPAAAGRINKMFSSISGGGPGPATDLAALAQRAFGGTVNEVRNNNPVAVGGVGALAGALLGGGRGAIGGGLLAALGSIAYAALKSAGQPGTAPIPQTDAEVQQAALITIQAMIEAAKADGAIDPDELENIISKIDAAGLDKEARSWIESRMTAPSDIPGLAHNVASPAHAAQVYGAAVLSIEIDTPAERDFLANFARELKLSPEVVARIHAELGVN
jgi:uncharacterized membrane protein YebE (DUF533 family)